jgi:putative aldouronate transport system permease protein
MDKKRKQLDYMVFINIFFILFSAAFILPFILIISISLTSEATLAQFGYSLLPKQIDFTAYKYIFSNAEQILTSYKVTTFFALFGTLASLFVMTLVAYPLSREYFPFRKQITFFIFFSTLFSGGLIPSYILNTQYLGLGNTILVYIIPQLATAWYIIIIRTFMQDLPQALVESAKLDGATEFKILFHIIIPISKPVLATIALFTLLAKWNDWNTALIYIKSTNLYSLQYLLQRILREAEFVRKVATDNIPAGMDLKVISEVPLETLKFALCIVVAGPMLLVFPIFQKYFAKGLTIGAVKG